MPAALYATVLLGVPYFAIWQSRVVVALPRLDLPRIYWKNKHKLLY